MNWFQFIKTLYSPETLDPRFVLSSSTPIRDALAERANVASKAQSAAGTRPPLWRTPEFYFYYVMFILVVPQMVKSPMEVSRASDPRYPKYEHLLSNGWILGRKADNSDSQYSLFRDNMLSLVLLLIAHPILRRIYDYFSASHLYTSVPTKPNRSNGLTQGLSPAAAADARLDQRVSFDLYFAAVFIIALHGVSAPKIFLILYINYKIAKDLPKDMIPGATWIFNVAILFANEFAHGYHYSTVSRFLNFGSSDWGAWLDGHGGLIPRWEVLFNFTILRLISFNMDYYFSLNSGGSSLIEKQLDPSNLSLRDRVNIPAKPEDFSFRKYLAYILYAPLYLSGPILTFNDYIAQQRYKSPTITRQRTILYAIRFGVVLLVMELLIHFIYAVAISKSDPDWDSYTPFQLSMLGYFNLNHIWLKLLILWRFFKLWALMDDVDAPENMPRCMSNNYSALAFWRGWHRSYNRWVVRYLYIPLGGSGKPGIWGTMRSTANFALVFMFVAVWHDINLRLLTWGWLITLFVIPEIAATLLFPAKKWKSRPNTYRVLCGIGAIGNILMMMAANLVGYAVGIDGLKGLLQGIFGSTTGVALFAAACGCLFIGVQVMFEVREEEKRAGIKMPN